MVLDLVKVEEVQMGLLVELVAQETTEVLVLTRRLVKDSNALVILTMYDQRKLKVLKMKKVILYQWTHLKLLEIC